MKIFTLLEAFIIFVCFQMGSCLKLLLFVLFRFVLVFVFLFVCFFFLSCFCFVFFLYVLDTASKIHSSIKQRGNIKISHWGLDSTVHYGLKDKSSFISLYYFFFLFCAFVYRRVTNYTISMFSNLVPVLLSRREQSPWNEIASSNYTCAQQDRKKHKTESFRSQNRDRKSVV